MQNNPTHRPALRGALFAGALLTLFASSTTAQAAGDAPTRNPPCFFLTQWQGWSSPSPDVLYLRVNMRDVYRVDLSVGSPNLNVPNNHLVSVNRGSSSICSAIDLDLKLSDGHGFSEPLIARSITKLTPEEVAAIPPKFRPN